MKTLPSGPFLGINNRLPDFALVTDAGRWLSDAVNVDIDNAGRARRRDGVTLVQAMTGAHSVFSTGSTTGFLVRSSVLYSFSFSPSYSETLVKILTVNDAVSYTKSNGSIYYSNGTDSGRIESGIWFPWALPTPTAPTVSAILGSVHAGKYQVAVRYYNSVTGEAGGISAATGIELASDGALRVTLPSATTGATHVHVLVSDLNGSQVYLHSSVATGTATLDIISVSGTTLTAEEVYAEPMPPCTNLFVHMGRLCGISGSTLYYGLPYRFGYYDAADGYIGFEEDISVAIANQFGTYVVTESKTFWLMGDLGKVERISDPLPYGGKSGTSFRVPHKPLVGWFGQNGFVIGDEQGQVVAATQDAVDVTPDNGAWSAVLETRGYRRVVSNGYCMNLENSAVSRYVDYDLTSVSGSFSTKTDGLYLLTGDHAIDAHIDLGKDDFGDSSLKRLPALYLGVSSETPMELRVTTPEHEDYRYEARSCAEEMRIQRVDPGKGLRSNWYDLSIYNTDGSNFTLAAVSFAPLASVRRI